MQNLQNYSVIKEIGHGGMATVWLAEHKTLHQPVAIKVLNKEFVHNENIRKRFLAEARNMFKMSHPNIIKVTDLIDDGDTVAFVMEYMEGQTLKEYLDKKGKLPDEEIRHLFTQMLDAVGYVHEQGLIHRDIKPSNFMISGKGVIKLLDFGIAKNTDSNSAEYTMTGTAQNMGTPMYMSPEQVKSTKDVTAPSDIYSLGVVLWQMVMGKKPYETSTISTWELQTKIVNENLPSSGSIFDPIIAKATQKELNLRYLNTVLFKNAIILLTGQNQQPNFQNSESTQVETKLNFTQFGETKISENEIKNAPIQSSTSTKEQDNQENTNKGISLKKALILCLGFVIIFSIRTVVKNSSSDYEDTSIQTELEDTSMQTEFEESTPVVVEEINLPNGFEYFFGAENIIFQNNSPYTAYLAVAYYNEENNNFTSVGWFKVDANSSFNYSLSSYSFNTFYWYAYATDELNNKITWSGDDGYFCINETDKFNYTNQQSCNNRIGFHADILKEGNTYQSFGLN